MSVISIVAIMLPALMQLLSSSSVSWGTIGTIMQALSAALTTMGAGETHSASMTAALGVNKTTTLLQTTLNNLQAAGQVDFGQELSVDGAYGPLTHQAVVAVQAKLGVTAAPGVADAQYVVYADLMARLG